MTGDEARKKVRLHRGDIMSPEKRSTVIARIRGKGTKPEVAIGEALREVGLEFEMHAGDLPGRPDFVFREARLAMLSIGVQSGPLIGVQKGPRLGRAEAMRGAVWRSAAHRRSALSGRWFQARFLKRQDSLPVSRMSQWWVSLSRRAVVILASPKTLGHSPKARLVVTMIEVRS